MGIFQKKQLIFDLLDTLKPKKIFSQKFFLNNKQVIYENDLKLSLTSQTHCLCIGKAASYHAQQWLLLANKLAGSCYVVTKKHHLIEGLEAQQYEACHPKLEQENILVTKQVLSELAALHTSERLVVFISGGASSLFEVPHCDFSHEQMAYIYNVLLYSGLSIEKVNEVRKALSLTKNAGLLSFIPCNEIYCFYVCDTPNLNYHSIGSSPCAFEAINIEDVVKNLESLGLDPVSERKVLTFLKTKKFIDHQQSLKINSEKKNIKHRIISSYRDFVNELLRVEAYQVRYSRQPFHGSLGDLVKLELERLSEALKEQSPLLLFSGGEADVKMPPNAKGLGGRNTHYVLVMAYELFELNRLSFTQEQLSRVSVFSVGSDGSDGNTAAAGAWVNYSKFCEAQAKGLSLKSSIESYDSYNFFSSLKTLIETGPTGTNIMDLRFIFLDNKQSC